MAELRGLRAYKLALTRRRAGSARRFFASGIDVESVRLVHDPDGDSTVLASDVDTADSLLAQIRGLMLRRSLPEDAALVFRFDGAATRDVHTLFVFFPIDVLWLVDGRVTRTERLRPWRGFARATADTIVELPAGAASDVSEGDRVVLEER